jgi:hypothetical protein
MQFCKFGLSAQYMAWYSFTGVPAIACQDAGTFQAKSGFFGDKESS